ncbi:MAG: family 10 glycosylhydrolase [Ruminococcus sp.]|nr:family 10 glycosylhydrolase [Ruminococcus sp.]
MRRYRFMPFLLSIVFLVISITVVSEENNHKVKAVNTATFDEISEDMKGIWVSYITLDMQNSDKSEDAFKSKIEEIINTSKESGFNTLIVQVRPFCDALYNSSYYPWSHTLTGTQGENPLYDPLQIMCDMCHDNGLKIHAWINPYRVSSSETPSQLSDDNPYIKDPTIGFEHNGNIYLDPSNQKAVRLIVNGVTEIVRKYDVDGIQFDDYFYPENSDNTDDDVYRIYAENEDTPLSKEEWRAQNVNTMIQKVYQAIHKNSDKIVFGISPQGNISNNMALGADVKKWCENEGYIDYICPQIYFSLDNPALTFEDSLDQWLNINAHDALRLYIGLAGYKGGTDEDEGTWLDNDDILKNEIEICQEKGTDGIILYSYECFSNDTNEAEIRNVANYLTGITQ